MIIFYKHFKTIETLKLDKYFFLNNNNTGNGGDFSPLAPPPAVATDANLLVTVIFYKFQMYYTEVRMSIKLFRHLNNNYCKYSQN